MVKSLEECGTGATDVDAEMVVVGFASEGGAVIECHTGLVNEGGTHLLVGESEGGEVEPREEGGFGEDVADLRQASVEELFEADDIASQIVQKLMEPFLAIAESGFGTYESEDVAIGHFEGVEEAKELAAELFVGDVGYGAGEAGDVEGLAGGQEGDGMVACDVGNGGIGGVGMARECKVGMNFVGNDKEVVTVANFGDAAEVVAAPDSSARVVWIGEDEEAAPFGTTVEVVEIDGETAVLYQQGAGDQMAVAALREIEERLIDGVHDQDGVGGLGEGLKDESDARHDAWDEMEMREVGGDVVVVEEPLLDSLPIAVRRYGIAEDFVVAAIAKCVKHKIGGAEIHVSHP